MNDVDRNKRGREKLIKKRRAYTLFSMESKEQQEDVNNDKKMFASVIVMHATMKHEAKKKRTCIHQEIIR